MVLTKACLLEFSVSVKYTCQLSCLRVENFDLKPAHACGPISHAWLKNVSCCRLAWHNFQKYVNSDPYKERKPFVKWMNDNTFLLISDFWSEKRWERARVYRRPKTGTGTSDVFGRLRNSSEDFGLLWDSSERHVYLRGHPELTKFVQDSPVVCAGLRRLGTTVTKELNSSVKYTLNGQSCR